VDQDVWLSALALLAAVALMVESVRRLRRLWILVRVEGVSMEPELRDGDEVLAAPAPALGWAESPKAERGPWWIKRVAAGPGEPMPGSGEPVPPGHYFLLSDNPAVRDDSRRHGPCPAEAVAGVMIRKF
jgi:signal peptidase I